MRAVFLGLSLVLALTGCTRSDEGKGNSNSNSTPYNTLSRADFNRLAVRANLPLYWSADADHDHAVDPAEVTTLLYYPTAPTWTRGNHFTSAFDGAYATLVAASKAKITDPRLELLAEDLDQGKPTLVRSDLTHLTAADKAFTRHMLTVGKLIDVLYDRTTGVSALARQVPADPLSQSGFRRNRSPACQASTTADNPQCSAIPGSPKLVVDTYPAALQRNEDFCAALEKRPDAGKLLDPYVVVRGSGQQLKAVPYTEAYPTEMTAIADELDAAAGSIRDPAEEPLLAYLRADAASFRSNDWDPADEAWSKMNAKNSKWFLRVAPDETYADPCGHKAAFHLTFARINSASLVWQDRLAPVRQNMENALATLVGKPYSPRTVGFHLPDFIDVIINAGDDRFPLGAITGQSLPDRGPVADEGRGRTVAMTNVYVDADSLAAKRTQAASLLDSSNLAGYVDSAKPGLFSTILHEATHNLGPLAGYKVNGRVSEEVFGGPLSNMLEELKAQTGAFYYIKFLRDRGIIDDTLAEQTHTDNIVYALSHIQYGATGADADTYAQLCAIQIGYLMDQGALTWDPKHPAANGTDTGAFAIHSDKLQPAVDKLMALVGGIKARGDTAAAKMLVAKYADSSFVPQKTIIERWQRTPQASFVYALDF